MNVILVYPPKAEYNDGLHGQGREWFPIGISSIAAYLETVNSNVKITCLDLFDETYPNAIEIIENHLKKDTIIGFTMMSEQRHIVLDLIDDLKLKHNIITVVGGPHASIMYEQMDEYYSEIDHIVIGEGERAFAHIVEKYQKGEKPIKLVKLPETDLNALPFAYFGLKHFEHGLNINSESEIPIVFSRGCTDRCTFCSTYKTWPTYRTRKSSDILNEMLYYRHYYKIHKFKFHDDSCTADTAELIELCKKMYRYKFSFEITARADQFTEELIYWLKKAGCYKVSVGIESGSEKMRKSMNKKLDIDAAKNNIQLLKNYGIHVHVLLIVGYPGETDQTIEETAQFLREVKPHSFSNLPGLMVVPGTPVYNLLKQKNWIDDKFWLTRKPCPYYDGEHTMAQIQKWSNYLRGVMRPKKILITAIVNEDERVFREYLKHIEQLEKDPETAIVKFFVLHNCEHLKKYLNKNEYKVCNNELTHDKTHTWTPQKFNFIANTKNHIVEIAVNSDVDYIFWIDSDILVQPQTLKHLLSLNVPIVGNIFWTKWPGAPEEMPNCWDVDQYSFFKKPDYLRKPGTYITGGTGACILVEKDVYKYADYSPIPNVTFSIWEDRAFCIKVACAGIKLAIDTHYPATHLYTQDLINAYFDDIITGEEV